MLALKDINGGIEITDKRTTLILEGSKVQLGEHVYNEAGEYESDGIEIVYGSAAALIVWERLQIVYVFSPAAPSGFEKAQFASCDVLILNGVTEEVDKNTMTTILDAYDPKTLVIGQSVKVEESFKASLKLQETALLKLTQQSLPVEGRESYWLV